MHDCASAIRCLEECTYKQTVSIRLTLPHNMCNTCQILAQNTSTLTEYHWRELSWPFECVNLRTAWCIYCPTVQVTKHCMGLFIYILIWYSKVTLRLIFVQTFLEIRLNIILENKFVIIYLYFSFVLCKILYEKKILRVEITLLLTLQEIKSLTMMFNLIKFNAR